MNKYKHLSMVVLIALFSSAGTNATPLVPVGFSVSTKATGLGQFPQSIDVTSDGTIYVAGSKQFAFGGNPAEGAAYSISSDGSVTQIGSFIGNNLVQGVKVLSNGDVFISSTSVVYNSTDGNAFSTFSSSSSPKFNAVDIKGDLAVIGNDLFMVGGNSGSGQLWKIDSRTGISSSLALSNDITALDYDALNNRLIGGGKNGIFEINPLSGAMNMLSFSDIGVPQTQIITDPFTGEQTEVLINPESSVGQIAIHPITGEIYFTTQSSHEILRLSNNGNVSIFSPSGFDTLTGNFETSLGLAFNDAGNKLYTTDRGTLYEISGAFVPIPAAIWLFLSGVIMLFGVTRR